VGVDVYLYWDREDCLWGIDRNEEMSWEEYEKECTRRLSVFYPEIAEAKKKSKKLLDQRETELKKLGEKVPNGDPRYRAIVNKYLKKFPKIGEYQGKYGYLRGSYFGGYSDVLIHMFDWMDWDETTPFDVEAFEKNLRYFRKHRDRPEKGRWDHLKNAKNNWNSLVNRQNAPIPDWYIKELEDFLKLGRKLIEEGEKPKVHISY